MRRKSAIVVGIVVLALAAAGWPLLRYRVREAERQARIAQEAAEAEERAAQAKAKAEAEAKAKADAEAKAKADAEAKARADAEAEAARIAAERAEAERKAAEEAKRLAELRQRSLDAFSRGVQAQKKGDRTAAIAAYREALGIDAGMAGAWTNLGLALSAEGRHDDAMAAAGRALGLPAMNDPKRRAHAQYAVGHVSLAAGRREEAQRAFEEALKSDARQASAAVALANLWNEQNEPEKAIGALMVAKAAGAESAALETALAVHAWRQGDVALAQSRATDALRLEPDAVDAKQVLGWTYLAQQRWGDAAQRLDEVARAHPKDADIHAALGYAYSKLGRHEEAVKAFDQSIALAPEHPTAHAYRGASLDAVGRVEEARKEYETASRGGAPAASNASKVMLATAAYKEKRYADARALAEQAVAANPKDAQARYVLGLSCFALGDRKCAGEQEYELNVLDTQRAAELRKLISKE